MAGRWWAAVGAKPLLFFVDVMALFLSPFPFIPGTVARTEMLVVATFVFQQAGLYRPRLTLSALDDLPKLLAGTAAGGSVAGLLTLARSGPHSERAIPIGIVVAGCAVILGRSAAYAFIRQMRRKGVVQYRVLILGAGRVAREMAQTLIERREYGLRPIGFWDPRPFLSEEELGLPVFGPESMLLSVIRESQASIVLSAFGSQPESEMVDILRTCDRQRCEIFVVPRLYELQHRFADMDEVRGTPLIRLRRPAYRSLGWRAKRIFDVVVAAAALLVLSPVLVACTVAVRLEGGPNVLFRQRRVGLDGREFDLLKFRSLKPVDDAEAETTWNIAHDDRLGRVGRFLRRSSLDELPQLWNVLRGDMTMVGPRPERPHFVRRFAEQYPRYMSRHRVPAGLTGWAQAHGLRGDTSINDRARFDNYYIENWSLWLDLKIILLTVVAVLKREGN